MPEAPSATLETYGLVWGVSSRFRAYLRRAARGVEYVDGEAGCLGDGRIHFPLVDAGAFDRCSLRGRLRFAGTVRFVGHGGAIDVALDGLVVDLSSIGGTVLTDVDAAARELVTFDQFDRQPLDTEVLRLCLSPRLSIESVDAFGGAYPVGMAFDELEIRIPAA